MRWLIGVLIILYSTTAFAQRGGTPNPMWIEVDGDPAVRARTIVVSEDVIFNVEGNQISLDIVSRAGGDERYLKLDTSNDPLTNELEIAEITTGAGGFLQLVNGIDYLLLVDDVSKIILETGATATKKIRIKSDVISSDTGTISFDDDTITTTGSVALSQDNATVVFGAGSDASIFYDGTDLVISSDAVAPSDIIIDCGANKTLKLEEPVYEDVRVAASAASRLGFTDPDWVQFKDDGAAGTGVYAQAFDTAKDEELFFALQIPHAWKIGTDLHAHIHWSPSDANSGNVTWKLEYTIANINGTFGDTTTLSDTTAAGGVDRKHQYSDLGDIDMSAYTLATDLSIMLICRVYRDVSDGDTYGSDAFLLEIDFHYQIDTLGSRAETSK